MWDMTVWLIFTVPIHTSNKKQKLCPPTAGPVVHQRFGYTHSVLTPKTSRLLIAKWKLCDKMDSDNIWRCLSNLPTPHIFGQFYLGLREESRFVIICSTTTVCIGCLQNDENLGLIRALKKLELDNNLNIVGQSFAPSCIFENQQNITKRALDCVRRQTWRKNRN